MKESNLFERNKKMIYTYIWISVAIVFILLGWLSFAGWGWWRSSWWIVGVAASNVILGIPIVTDASGVEGKNKVKISMIYHISLLAYTIIFSILGFYS